MRRLKKAETTGDQIARHLTSEDVSNLSVAQTLGVSTRQVAAVRKALGLATYRRGRRVPEATIEEAIARRVRPIDSGHAEWTGNVQANRSPMLFWRGMGQTAYRAVFRLHYGREPDGNISHTCDRERCVAAAHLEDRVLRAERRAAETGGAR
jgi:hypothetical protein